jgi:hypothetical protein
VVADDPSEPLGLSDDAGSGNAQLPQVIPRLSDITTGVASHTVTPGSQHSEPPDAAEDTSAYAETLEGGDNTGHGVPFYPGKNVSFFFLFLACDTHHLVLCCGEKLHSLKCSFTR